PRNRSAERTREPLGPPQCVPDVARGSRFREPAGGSIPGGDARADPGERASGVRTRGAGRSHGQPRSPDRVGRARCPVSRARLVVVLAAASAGCATPAPTARSPIAAGPRAADAGVSETGTPDAPFRSVLPEPGPPVAFQAPVPEVKTLRNGLTVWIVEQREVPLVTAELVIRAGEDTDPPGSPGTAS